MSQNYHRKHVQTGRRKSTTYPIYICEQEEIENGRRLSVCPNFQRRLSTISQLYLPNGDEYHVQQRIPPTGLEYQQNLITEPIKTDENLYDENHEDHRRLSIITKSSSNLNNNDDINQSENKILDKKYLFIMEPILTGLIIFPILVLFWEAGWNLVLIYLNVINGYNSSLHITEFAQEDQHYSSQSLIYPYLIVQFILLLYYILQDKIYNYLKIQKYFIQLILLKLHIFLLGTVYIIQWEMLWTIWDQYTPTEWYFELTLSFTSLFALVVFIGHLSDLVCSPFLVSYDSIEYNIQFGCPLLTRQVNFIKKDFFLSFILNFLLI